MAGIYKTEGIVLKTLKYSESSIIVDIYTKKKGLRSFIVSGLSAKKNKSKASCFRHLNILNIVAYDKENGGLARIKEQGIAYFYNSLSYDVMKSSVGLFAIEVCRSAIKEAESNERLYDFIYNTFIKLDKVSVNLSMEPIKFLVELMPYIGITPMNNSTKNNCYFNILNGRFESQLNEYCELRDISKVISELLKGQNQNNILSKPIRNEVIDILLKYYQLHIEDFKSLKSLQVLREIF